MKEISKFIFYFNVIFLKGINSWKVDWDEMYVCLCGVVLEVRD